MRFSVLLVAVLVGAVPASAQERYQPWAAPGGAPGASAPAGGDVQELIDKLNALVDEAEKSRAADPYFLRDLRELARTYSRPWRQLALADDFVDGDFTENPAWTVKSGRFWVETGWGLRSSVVPPAGAAAGAKPAKPSGRDVAIGLLGQILKQATGEKKGQEPTAVEPTFAAIYTPAAFSNAFAIEIELSSWQKQGRLEFGPYQGKAQEAGYRLAYSPGGQLELLRVSSRGVSIVERTTETLSLEDQAVHRIDWTRHEDGTMAVSVDGKKVLDVPDRGFRDAFQGFVLINRGGDYIVKRLAIYGTG